MTPRFGPLTRGLACVFAVAGVGAGIAGLSQGQSSVPGTEWYPLELLLLAAGFLIVCSGLFLERRWAWWAGIGVSGFTVVAGSIQGIGLPSVLIWSCVLSGFGVSAFQGRRDATRKINGAP